MHVPSLIPEGAVDAKVASIASLASTVDGAVHLHDVAFPPEDERKVNSPHVALEKIQVWMIRGEVCGTHQVQDRLRQQSRNGERRYQVSPQGLSPLLAAHVRRQLR